MVAERSVGLRRRRQRNRWPGEPVGAASWTTCDDLYLMIAIGMNPPGRRAAGPPGRRAAGNDAAGDDLARKRCAGSRAGGVGRWPAAQLDKAEDYCRRDRDSQHD